MVLAPRWRARISPISAGQACSVWAQVPLCHRVILVHRMPHPDGCTRPSRALREPRCAAQFYVYV
jgi:hypothetical protein